MSIGRVKENEKILEGAGNQILIRKQLKTAIPVLKKMEDIEQDDKFWKKDIALSVRRWISGSLYQLPFYIDFKIFASIIFRYQKI